MNQQKITFILLFLLMFSTASGQFNVLAGEVKSQGEPLKKINFDLDQLNDQGLYGPPDGLRALAYEFCIIANPVLTARVKAIDPTVVVYPGSKGRIRCSQEEYLCIGNTHQPEFRAVLLKIASLPFIKQINQCFFE
jgi:hypothetical protein